ncbi:AraC family transcriptional regulator [Sphaerotilaceae bacterium SBD11-9]
MPDKHTLSAQPAVRYLDLLARAVAHIGEHLAEPLSNETLAAQAAMSPFHFHRLFRAHVGTTVAGYVTLRRLQRACELLADDRAVVLDVALAVGYDSAQALAKAMRRELDTTPTAVRAGAAPRWQQLYDRRGHPTVPEASTPAVALQPRVVELPERLVLTATGRGMHEGRMARAAGQAAAELWSALAQAGLAERATLSVGMLPDEPEHSDDPQARIWIGAGFDTTRPTIALQGSLAWRELQGGRYAVFHHLGPYDGLHRAWAAIYGQWLPATGYALRDVPPFEHYLNDPRTLPPAQWRTDLHVPLL